MKKQKNILDYFGEINAEFLHAKGKKVTFDLVKRLSCKPNEQILEVGLVQGVRSLSWLQNTKTLFFMVLNFQN